MSLRTARLKAVSFLAAVLCAGCGGDITSPTDPVDETPPPPPIAVEFESPQTCETCHPMHFAEWQGSVMHYAALSPVFRAFELTMRQLSEGAFAANGDTPNFCIGCHSPTGDFNNELPDFVTALDAQESFLDLSPVSQEGLSCDFCHTVTGPDIEGSLLKDGIANRSLLFAPDQIKRGPLSDPMANPYHASVQSDFIRSAEFCGSCHDVRVPKPDPVTGEPFQRLENLFTEWQKGPYNSTNNPYGRVVRCQDCHMSMYPLEEPGVFPQVKVAQVDAELPTRSHAIHAFTAVSIPLVDDPRMPSTYGDDVDAFRYPTSQVRRREQMLQAAVTMTAEGTPNTLAAGSGSIPIRLVLTNVGAGHRVPAGFSQEREVWVELTVRDDAGVIYTSGHLHDKPHPETGEDVADGRTHDEDLEHRHFEVDIETFDSHVTPGPDADQRPHGKNLGIASFQNRFVRIHEDGEHETVINPLLADHMDNSHSLDMLVPTEVKYDVPVPARGIRGDVRVSARLRYRAFPPEFLRILAIRHPELVNEDIVDRNTIVEMAQVEKKIAVEKTDSVRIGQIIFTEIMFHTTTDNDGEWLELHNVSRNTINLGGCTLSDDDGDAYQIGAGVTMAPGEYRVFRHNQTGIRLGNSQGDTVRLDCDGLRIDRVDFTTGFPNTRDHSLTLDPQRYSAAANDDGSNWCDGRTPHSVGLLTRYGTPGWRNDNCF